MAEPTPIRPGAYDPSVVGSDVIIEPDAVLEAAKGKGTQIVVVRVEHDGTLIVSGSHSAPECHVLLHMAMLELCKNMTEGLLT